MVKYHFGRQSKFKFKYCEMLIEHMAAGNTFSTFAAEIGVTVSTLHSWRRNNQKFAEAYEIAQECYNAYFENLIKLDIVGILPANLKEKGSKRIKGKLALSFLQATNPARYGGKNNANENDNEIIIKLDADDMQL